MRPPKDNRSQSTHKTANVTRRRRRRNFSPRQRLRRKVDNIVPWRFVFITILVMVVFVVVSQAVLLTDAINRLNTSWTSISRILETVRNKPGSELTLSDIRRLDSGISDLSRSLASLKGRAQPLRPILELRPDWAVSYDLLLVAQSLTAATNDILIGVEPSVQFMVGGEDDDTVTTQLASGERVVELLIIGRGRFVSAERHLEDARERLNNLDLSNVSAGVLLQVEELEGYYSEINDINTLLLDAPDLLSEILGLNDTQNYLILSQNNDELRPSGGYISTYGWMTVRSGRVSNFSYSATTVTSPFPPPGTFASQFEVPDWWIRYRQPLYAAWDGSWYADFPSTAEMALQYYEAGGNPHTPIDGVIAIDIVGFEYILEVLGGVTIADYNVVITSENFREIIYDIRATGEEPLAHKQFLSRVYQQIIIDWQNGDLDDETNAAMWGAILRALQEKHIMIYFSSPRYNEALGLLHWSGAQSEAVDHDYIMVADANLGNKSNRSISRQLTYDVEIMPDHTVHSRLTVAYNYPSTIADDDPAIDARYHGPLDYDNLMQVFVPTGSNLTNTNNLQREPEIVYNDTHTLFVSRISVEYDGGGRFQFEYETSPVVGRVGEYNQYRLLIQKQPGMISEMVSVQVSLPLGARIISTSPEPIALYQLDQQVLDFRFNLTTDQWLEIIYQDPPE